MFESAIRAASSMLNCPLCASATVTGFMAIPHDMPSRDAILSIKECGDCGLAWQHPRYRSTEESVTVQLDSYANQREGTYYDPDKRRATVETEIDFVEAFFERAATLLDIGAGDGTFIAHAASRGWRCIGVDPAARRAELLPTTSTGSFQLIRGTSEAIGASERFDAVTLWDVIEHLDDPESVIAAAVARLQPDGLLFIETGNYQSADRIASGADWWAYAADHRWYFAPPTVRALLERAGLDHFALGTRVLRPWWRGKHTYAGPSWKQTLKRVIRSPLTSSGALKRHTRLKSAASDWKSWAGLSIFTIVASRQPVTVRRGAVEVVALQ